ncbi:bifunctional sterol desaturase/short chain dehydrogenase [Planktothrix rubescens]|uniref:bifunctional sterol desaturase/short chain dehydrogenase n=1 Tax=Planktothrix rubescens TaxID=59512 RepID=UPI00047B9B13|nr:bifunctional sterol desaturase/short chain dehydrogenase [Planktothrix rubescens]
MIMVWIGNLAWGVGSIVGVEMVRDLYHVSAHIFPPLIRLHNWHHRVFRPDLTPVSEEIYRQAHWYNDVPEAGVMLSFSLIFLAIAHIYTPENQGFALLGCIYTLSFLFSAIGRGMGIPNIDKLTDLTHTPGEFDRPPAAWMVNRTYHWRHHFDNQNAYFCGTLTLLDKIMGTALSLKGKTVAVTGASGTLGQALLFHLHAKGAKVLALTSGDQPLSLTVEGETIPIKTVTWQVGQEQQLGELFQKVDILIINHGINVNGMRTEEAISQSYQVNTFSGWRLLELFLSTVKTNADIAKKEVWVNTSEAEVGPAFSPLYELSKRTLGDLITLRRLDAPCVIRKLILGPFKSNLNPIGVMSPNWVAKQVIKLAQGDVRNIIITINPLTFIAFPIKQFWVSTYFKLFSRQPN